MFAQLFIQKDGFLVMQIPVFLFNRKMTTSTRGGNKHINQKTL